MRKISKIKKLIKEILFLIIFSTIVLSNLLYQIDKKCILDNKLPLFSFPVANLKDGGTIVYIGFFYQIIYWNRLYTKDINGKKVYYYITGYEQLPLLESKYIPFLNNNIEPTIIDNQ